MIRVITVILVLMSQVAWADRSLIFSEYRSNIRINEIDSIHHVITFSGEIEAEGILVFRLDIVSENEFGEAIFADFIPSANDKNLFPAVVSGFYAKKLDRVSLHNADELYRKVFGEGYKAESREVRKAVSVTLRRYATSVECDSRQYVAELVSFRPAESLSSISDKQIVGC